MDFDGKRHEGAAFFHWQMVEDRGGRRCAVWPARRGGELWVHGGDGGRGAAVILRHGLAGDRAFSAIHVLSVLALWSVHAAIAGWIREHRDILSDLVRRGPIISGLFTFLPKLLLNRMICMGFELLDRVALGLGKLVAPVDMALRLAPSIPPEKGVQFYP